MSKFIFVDRTTGLDWEIYAESHGEAIDLAYEFLNEPKFRSAEDLGNKKIPQIKKTS